MDLFQTLVLGYSTIVTVLLTVALILHFTGNRGKFHRALLISGAAGIIVPLAIYYSYPYLFPPPLAPPSPPVNPHILLLAQFFASFMGGLPALGHAIGYSIARIVNPLVAGVVAILVAFSLSFLIPTQTARRTGSKFFK